MQFLRRKDHLSLSTFLTNTNLHKWYENIEVGLQYFFFFTANAHLPYGFSK